MRTQRWRDIGLQALLAAGMLAALWWLLDVTAANMQERGIRSGFSFLLDLSLIHI